MSRTNRQTWPAAIQQALATLAVCFAAYLLVLGAICFLTREVR